MDASQATRVREAGVNTPEASVTGPSAAIAAPQESPQPLTISRRRRSTAKVFDEAMQTAGSGRRFRSEPVPDDVLYRVLDNARLAWIHRFAASELGSRCARSWAGAEDRSARIRRMRK